MITTLRNEYNSKFTAEKYQTFLKSITDSCDVTPKFRISETPVFIGNEFRDKLLKACEDIVDVLVRPDFKAMTDAAIPPHCNVPNEDEHPQFLVIDFGVCADKDGSLSPKLIELQGFPSMYVFQHLLAERFRTHFDLPENMTHLFNVADTEGYVQLLRKVIVGDSKPENVVLLEVEPHRQNTQIDFWATSRLLGIKTLCVTHVIKEGKKLFYRNDVGKLIHIEKIYNRVIFDELLQRKDLKMGFNFSDALEVEWIGHPNWFFRISKYTMPFLEGDFVPKTYFLKDLKTMPTDLENYVLKPLFSFSGQGVKINVTQQDLDEVTDPSNFILQEKVQYVPALQTLNDPAKIEIRMLLIWERGEKRPKLVNNLIRLSKGEMIGVRYNKDKDWVGASVGLFYPPQ